MMTNPNPDAESPRKWDARELAQRWCHTPFNRKHDAANLLGLPAPYELFCSDGGSISYLYKLKDAGKLDALWELIKPTS